jgi:hypothetical protein
MPAFLVVRNLRNFPNYDQLLEISGVGREAYKRWHELSEV